MVMDNCCGRLGKSLFIGSSKRSCSEKRCEAQIHDIFPSSRSSLFANKKGYFYFVEIAMISMLMVSFFFVFSPKSETSYQNMNDISNLKHTGYGTLKSLDEKGILSAYIDSGSLAASDFSALKIYIKGSLPETVGSKIEYTEDLVNCYSEAGASTSCGLNLTSSDNLDVARADYTYSKRPTPVTIHLFLWRTL